MTGRITAMGQRKYSLELRARATRMALEARDDAASTGSHGSPAHRGASRVRTWFLIPPWIHLG